MIRVAINGYGNLGRGVEQAITKNADMEVAVVFTRRDPDSVTTQGAPVAHVDDMAAWADKVDVCLNCGGSATDLIEQTPVIYLKAFGPICEVGAESYSFLKPGKNIEEKGDYLFRELTGNCVGVHVRRTDHTDAIANSPLALFAGRMKKELEADQETSFFVATDDKEVRRELKELLPDAKLIFPQSDVIDRDSKEGIEEAFVEMIALSKCRKILGSYNSTFSLLPSYIGNIPLETVCRKES